MMMYVFLYFIMSAFAAWLFYDSFVPMVFMIPFIVPYTKAVKRMKKKKGSEELSEGFLRSLGSVSSSLAAGICAENAFVLAQSDMEKLYGKSAAVTKELERINMQVNTGTRLSDAISAFAARAGIREISDFAQVFGVASQKGADFPKVISSCVGMIEDRRSAEREAEILIRAKQYEQRVMCIIPPGILLYLRLSSGGFIRALYHNTPGVLIMTACLVVYILAICLSCRIAEVTA